MVDVLVLRVIRKLYIARLELELELEPNFKAGDKKGTNSKFSPEHWDTKRGLIPALEDIIPGKTGYVTFHWYFLNPLA